MPVRLPRTRSGAPDAPRARRRPDDARLRRGVVVLIAFSTGLLVVACQHDPDAGHGAGAPVQPVVQASNSAGGDALPVNGRPGSNNGDPQGSTGGAVGVPTGGSPSSGPGAAPPPAGATAPAGAPQADPGAPTATGLGQVAPVVAPTQPAQAPNNGAAGAPPGGDPAPPAAPAPAPPPVGPVASPPIAEPPPVAEPPPPPAAISAPAPGDNVGRPPQGGSSLLPELRGGDSIPGPTILEKCVENHTCASSSPTPPTNPLDSILRRAGIRN